MGNFLMIIFALLVPVWLGAAEVEEESPWFTDLPAALDAAGDDKPMALLFGSETCIPCARMQAESSSDPEVRRALQEVVGVALDVHRHIVLAHRFNALSTPTMVLINRRGELVRRVVGYLPPADLATTLRVLALHGDDRGRESVSLQAPDLAALAAGPDGLPKLIALLGSGDPAQRAAVRALLAQRPEAIDQLWPLLEHERLGVRVDASAVLSELAGESRYDAFAAAEDRQRAASAWQASTDETESVP